MTASSPIEKNTRGLLLLAAAITIIAWQFDAGQKLLYPFTLLATYAHEMGHGMTAMLLGADFQSMELNLDGSGVAQWRGSLGRIGRAMVAAGGLVGPSIAGATILVLSRRASRARPLLYAMGLAMVLSALLVVRSLFGFVFVGAFAALMVAVAHYGRSFAPFLVQLVGVQLCLAVFRDVSYMFSSGAIVGGALHPSDSAQIADALFLPYWFWGALTAGFSFAVLGLGLYVALSSEKSGPARV